VDVFGGKAGAVGLNQEAADGLVSGGIVFGRNLGPDDGDVSDGAGGDPHFFAVEDVLITGFAGSGCHASGIRSEAWLG
jgi:hypothetical protein